jgi:Zn finger protein HypA/HybF involved in hydrogenase expression
MATAALRFDEGVPDWAVDLLVEAIVAYTGTKIPRPLIKAAVKGALRAVSEVDLSIIRDILERLSMPTSIARDIWKQFRGDAEDVLCEIECPESGDMIPLEDGDGEYTCPDCKADIIVENGEATHAYEVECPVAEETFWAKPEDGVWECPLCDLEVTVEDGEAIHDDVPEVRCPRSGDTIQLEQGDGTYSCPDCGEDIDVEDGVASHTRRPRPSLRAPRRRRVRK